MIHAGTSPPSGGALAPFGATLKAPATAPGGASVPSHMINAKLSEEFEKQKLAFREELAQ